MKNLKIRALIVLLAFALVFSLSACGGSDAPKDTSSKDASSEESANAPVEKSDDSAASDGARNETSESESSSYTNAKEFKTSKSGKIELLESGYSYEKDESGVVAGVIIGNANSEKSFEYAGVRATAYGEDGSILGTTEAEHEIILPGEKQAICIELDTKDKKPKRVEFKAKQGDEASDTESAFKAKDVTVSNTSENIDKEYGDVSITGEVENKSKKDLKVVYMTVLLRKKGKIVYAYEELMDELPKGEKTPFEISFSTKVKHDKYEFSIAK